MKPKRKSKIVDRNFLIQTEFLDPRDGPLFFGEEPTEEKAASTTMLDLLVETGIFPSKGAAKKNGWKDRQQIPDGFSEFEIGKLNHRITVFKPSEAWNEDS